MQTKTGRLDYIIARLIIRVIDEKGSEKPRVYISAVPLCLSWCTSAGIVHRVNVRLDTATSLHISWTSLPNPTKRGREGGREGVKE